MTRVIAFTQGMDVPSARFRVRQLIPHLASRGVGIEESISRYGSYPPPGGFGNRASWAIAATGERAFATRQQRDYDIALIQREMVSTLYTAERLLRIPCILDVDDAIWLNARRDSSRRLAEHCGNVIAGNAYVAEYFAKYSRVFIVPTAVDAARFSPHAQDPQPTMVWSGSSSGLRYLYEVEAALSHVMSRMGDLRLRVLCDRPPTLSSLPRERVDYFPWSPGIEATCVATSWVGLMPLADTPWTRGKCSYKLLTYLVCGVPSVASPVGMNAQVVAESGGSAIAATALSEWSEGIASLVEGQRGYRELAIANRGSLLAKYGVDAVAGGIARAISAALTG